MKRADQDEMDRLRAAVDRLSGELYSALQDVVHLEQQLLRKEGELAAYSGLVDQVLTRFQAEKKGTKP